MSESSKIMGESRTQYQSAQDRLTQIRNHQERILNEARNTRPPAGYKPTNYEFQGVPVYRDEDGVYRLSTKHMIFRRDLEKKKK